MSASTTPVAQTPTAAGYESYRAVSLWAMAALVLGIVSLIALIFPYLIVLCGMGMVAALVAVLTIRRRRDELTGMGLAKAGLLLSAGSLLASSTWHTYVHFTEVPPGYEPIAFYQLQPDEAYPHLPIPPFAMQLNGQRIFIKGYVYPDGQQTDIKRFVLVADLGTCCFGGQPKLTHMIEVTLRDPLRVDYSFARRKLTGIFKVSPVKKPIAGLDGVYYQLDADGVW